MSSSANVPFYRRPKILLSFDVLLNLSEHLPRSSLIALMSTCKELRRYGVRILLNEDRAIAFEQPQQVTSFCQFINSNIPAGTSGRAAHIRMLDLNTGSKTWSYKEDVFVPLSDVIRNASSLYALDVSEEGLTRQTFMSKLTSTGTAFSTLRRLRLDFVGPQCQAFAKSLCDVPLKSLIIRLRIAHLLPIPGVVGDGGLIPFHTTVNIFANSLEELHVSNPKALRRSAAQVRLDNVHLPRVSTVSLLNYILPAECDVEMLISAFPNAERITLTDPPGKHPLPALNESGSRINTGGHGAGLPAVEAPLQAAEPGLRDRNERAQRNVRWHVLEYLCGTLRDLYLLTVRAQVEHLVITGISLNKEKLEQLHAVVRECAPMKLTLAIGDLMTPDGDVELVQLIPQSLTRPLRYLQIDLLAWTSASQLLRQLRLLGLNIGTVRTLVVRTSAGVLMEYKKPLGPEDAHEEYEKFAIQTAQFARSLRHVGLPEDLFGPLPPEPEPEDLWTKADRKPRQKETLFWSIDRSDDGPVYVDKVSRHAAVKLLESETHVSVSPFES